MKEVLFVDGYNVIGAWSELREAKSNELEVARDLLIDMLAEYHVYTGRDIYIVFDAHQVSGNSKTYTIKGIHVIYTKQEETADEWIERMVRVTEKHTSRIYVATSDVVERQVTFGDGALRISTSELKKELERAKRRIRKDMEKLDANRNTLDNRLDQKVLDIFEKWRRN
jgi:predicted RNA-binding protein with PIN domain